MATEDQKPAKGACEEQGSGVRIGILGGTFDPIHIGHLIIAEEAKYQFRLDRVIFIPAGVPPHKPNQPITDKEHRFNMTVLATEDNPSFQVSRIEIDRSGPSYAVDTLAALRKIYGEDTQLFFIIGADAILEILTWYQPEKLKSMCRFVATTRPGYRLEDVKEKLPKEFLERITFMEAPGVDISATDLRNRAASGRPIKYMVPKAVEDYIIDNKLYTVDK